MISAYFLFINQKKKIENYILTFQMILDKEVNMLKKNLLLLTLISGLVLVSGCINGGNQTTNNTNKTQLYSGDEFTFNYPNSWQQIQSMAPNSTVAVGDPESADSNGNVPISVVVQKTIKQPGITLLSYYNSTYTQFAAQNLGYRPISEGTVLINGVNTLENIYYINSGGIQKQERAIWIQNNRIIYVILCSAPVSDFSSQQENFDIIVNSFKLV